MEGESSSYSVSNYLILLEPLTVKLNCRVYFDPLFMQCNVCAYARLNKVAAAVGQSGANSLLDLLSAMEGLTRIEEIG